MMIDSIFPGFLRSKDVPVRAAMFCVWSLSLVDILTFSKEEEQHSENLPSCDSIRSFNQTKDASIQDPGRNIKERCPTCIQTQSSGSGLRISTMAPNQRSRLLYENDDLEKVTTFEKKGEYCSILEANSAL